MESLNKCPICDHESHKEFLLVNDYSITKEDFHIVQCDGCDFKFTNPRPAQNEIGKYYESDEYVSHSDTNEGIVNKIYQMVKVCTLSKKLALLNRLRPKGNVLDIGAGTGAFLKFCGDNGWEITGVEPDESARKIAQETNHISLKEEDHLATIEDSSYDIITMWHVLEHVHNLKERVGELKRILKDNGRLIIAVPNCNSYDAKHYKNQWAAYDVPRHLYHFTPADITKLIEQFQMKVVEVKPMIFDSFYVSMLSEKYQNNPGIKGLIKAVITGFISNYKGINKRPGHSSQIYIIANP
ncbi:MAG: class I SAM-dependent methyltransferase [Flavobacteriales bacterium]|nr:class I SAM-dependent methyltransferase [Flavobacteriales bacterium]